MGVSKEIADLLRANLALVQRPEGYDAFREMLIRMKPNRMPPSIKESPENRRPLDNVEGVAKGIADKG
jgi:hypothetical protein